MGKGQALRHNQKLAPLGFPVTFISGDKTLLTAAEAENLPIDSPFNHLSPEDTPTS